MCNCVDVEIGSYGNQVELPAPSHMKGKSIGCLTIRDTICIDACLEKEIMDLWMLGIFTTGCCCGHNKRHGYIGVVLDHVPHMIQLGYEKIEGCTTEFLPQTTSWK